MARTSKSAKKTTKKGLGQGRRPKGEDLVSVMAKILSARKSPMRVTEVADAAKKAGYQTSSPSFVRIVGMRLSMDSRFKRTSWGYYTMKKGGK
ncbi:MAG: hypothetical protein JNJ88_11805 [Planctomycetes bacterium]|nr:hypothetical protein [Planctomycetota bacterium]